MASEQPRSWYSWLSLAEFWYHTNFHSSTKITPFQVVYGQPPPIHTPYLPGSAVVEVVDRSLAAREKILHLLKHNSLPEEPPRKGGNSMVVEVSYN